jgi:hypothetical protein
MPVGLICDAKRLGVHESGEKAAACFPEDFRKGACNWGQACTGALLLGARTEVQIPQRITNCRLTALPSNEALAGS